MGKPDVYHLYVSAAFDHTGVYDELVALLNASGLSYEIHRLAEEKIDIRSMERQDVQDMIQEYMEQDDILLSMAGTFRGVLCRWQAYEAEAAMTQCEPSLPIVSIRINEDVEVEEIVRDYSDRIIDFDQDSIVTAIQELA